MVKVDNTGNVPLGKPTIRVVDVSNNINLYGGDSGFRGAGFHQANETYGPSEHEYILPGERGYLAVNVNMPVGPILKVEVTLVSEPAATTVRDEIEFVMNK